tara:strand:- start:750 stop:971 length:222 start_codon:yes stop_codon:yes gene_type:complete
MSKKKPIKESSKMLKEISLDGALKGVVGLWFGDKFIKRTAKRIAVKDPEVKAQMAKLHNALADFDAIMAKYEK